MSKEPKGDRWSRNFNRVKNNIAHGPKTKLEAMKQAAHDKTSPVRHDEAEAVQSAKNKANGLRDSAKEFAKAPGFSGKMKFAGSKIGNKIAKSDTVKKAKELIKKIQAMARVIVANAKPILIISLIVLIGGNAIMFIISISQSASQTPHYYCDTEASSSLKKTSVYKQYCAGSGGFELDNLNGHYIIQDGSGPCTDCSYNNMFMRYYTTAGLNYFDYLWKEDGMYAPEGQTLTSSSVSTPNTIRRIINGGSNSTTDTKCNASLAHGTKAFSAEHGKTITMANWGYLRDDSLDIESFAQTDDYYLDNTSNDKWVFDLSLNNRAAGTTWSVFWEYTLTIDDISCIVASVDGKSITGETIKNILNGQDSAVGEAGVVLYYDYTGDGIPDHAILLTEYDENTGYWRVIDSAKGLSGGFEGPMDGSRHFGIHDSELNSLLNSDSNSSGNFALCRISYCSN